MSTDRKKQITRGRGLLVLNSTEEDDDKLINDDMKEIKAEKQKLSQLLCKNSIAARKITFIGEQKEEEQPQQQQTNQIKDIKTIIEESRNRMRTNNNAKNIFNYEMNTAEINQITSNNLFDKSSQHYVQNLKNNIHKDFTQEKEYGITSKVVKKDSNNERARVNNIFKAKNAKLTVIPVNILNENEFNAAQIKLDTLNDETNIRISKSNLKNDLNI